MKISAVIIAKNEEVMLGACLGSLVGVDEIVVCDTGSSDKTVEIALQYSAKVGYFEWCDNFAQARNYANTLATGDWIITIDADEKLLTDVDSLRLMLEEYEEKSNEKSVNVTLRANGSGVTHCSQRVYRNLPEVKWHGAVHEVLNVYTNASINAVIEYGTSPAHLNDPNRVLRILEKTLNEKPGSSREMYYLAREYYYRRNWPLAIEKFTEYINQSIYLPERCDACLLRAECLSALGRHGDACDSVFEALKYNANFREALVFLSKHMDPKNAERWADYARIADNTNVLFVR